MQFLRQNTAVIVTVGPFYDKTDGVTIEDALTITNERITLTADTDDGSAPTLILDNITGATAATANDLDYIANEDAGYMKLELAAANVNRVGRMSLSITDAANHVPVFHEYFVLPQAIFDWLTGVIVPLPANTTHVSGTAQTAGNLAALLTTVTTYVDTEVAATLAAVDTEIASILALLDDARAEPGQGAPAVNPDMATKVDYLYKWARNKKDNDGTDNRFYADDASTIDHKQSVAESGGTVTVGEMRTGA